MKQRDAFLESEGDAWLRRNSTPGAKDNSTHSDELIAQILLVLAQSPLQAPKILEIGCSSGNRLHWLRENRNFECYGVDPSSEAVELAKTRGINSRRGTADSLPYDDSEFDFVVFGFCLYLCDREDLFRIAFEADRVLRNPGWMLIQDFYSVAPSERPYHHRPGIFSYKMDYRTLFDWHPAYSTYFHKVAHHVGGGYTDDPAEWVATSVLRKNLRHHE